MFCRTVRASSALTDDAVYTAGHNPNYKLRRAASTFAGRKDEETTDNSTDFGAALASSKEPRALGNTRRVLAQAAPGSIGNSNWASDATYVGTGARAHQDLSALVSTGPSSSTGNAGDLLGPEGLNKLVAVKFHLKYKTNYGQGVKLLGSHPKLGSWNLRNSVELRWSAGDQWVATVHLPAGGVYEYKYVLIDFETKQALEWQNGSNAVLAVVVSETEVNVYDNWSNAPGALVQVDEDTMTRETKLQKWANEMTGYWKESRKLQIELVQKNAESQGLRSELAALRMELSLERQAKQNSDALVSELQVENASLKAQLVQKTVELNATLAEVLQLLDNELDDVEVSELEDGAQGQHSSSQPNLLHAPHEEEQAPYYVEEDQYEGDQEDTEGYHAAASRATGQAASHPDNSAAHTFLSSSGLGRQAGMSFVGQKNSKLAPRVALGRNGV
ncbi:hypothetical protein QJQ45_017865 [Haematococcus lacustris]|nr:hypothetical protein QJQ45_017865 [Haematococcus lacustris]